MKKLRNMTIPQIQKCVGTTFIFRWDSDSIPAIVAAFVPGKGFTCLATESTSANGVEMRKDKNGEICLIGVHAEYHNLMEEASVRCREIRDTGEYLVPNDSGGSASCALS